MMTTRRGGPNGSQQFAFRVDTHLFRELGEFLVGRNSTALVELVKNAYDADATEVVIHGEGLDDAESGLIVLTDNGHGMTPEEFATGFLTIAARTKSEGPRLSRRYRRTFTGAKGVGRLAAHKLARELRILSIPDRRGAEVLGVQGTVDWDQIEKHRTLDELIDIPDVTPVERGDAEPGTRIELRRLRSRWTDAERRRFLREVTGFQPPEQLLAPLPKDIADGPLLFTKPTTNNSTANDPGLKVTMSGVLEQGDEFWPQLYDIASWIVEIDASQEGVKYGIAPTHRIRSEHPGASVRTFDHPHPDPADGPFFQARIVIREGRINLPRETVEAHAGIRAYMEGFRVLPYGERGDDWLSLNSDATTRAPIGLRALTESGLASGEASEREELLILPNLNYHGAVFLTAQGAENLRLLVNREGFIPDQSFESLRELVRLGVDLSTRVRARFKEASRRGRADVRTSTRVAAISPEPEGATPRGVALSTALAAVGEELSAAQRQLAKGDIDGARASVEKAIPSVNEAVVLQHEAMSEEAMLRVLASVGLQTSSVVHELGGLATASRELGDLVASLRSDRALGSHGRRALAPLERSLNDLQHAIERQAAYLVDVVSAEARRRRSRQPIAQRFDDAARLIRHLADQQKIKIVNEIPTSLRSSPMFPAELTAVFANLLTNAVKAAGQGGTIKAHGGTHQGVLSVRVENTGVAVDVGEAEQWFEPFESTTTVVHPVLGQGMGLGLTITRRILEEYRATIDFVDPSPGFATAVEIQFSS